MLFKNQHSLQVQQLINNQFSKMNNPPKATLINANTPLETLAKFLKFSPPGQFHALNKNQIDLLLLVLETAYLLDYQENQRPIESASRMLLLRKGQIICQQIQGENKVTKSKNFPSKALKQQTKPQLTQSRINKYTSWYSCFAESLQALKDLPKKLMSKENKLNYKKEVLPQLNLQPEQQPLYLYQPQARQSQVVDCANHKNYI